MKKNSLQTWLFSSLGVAAMLGVLILCNALASRVKTRIDLTEERAYTLSPGARAILKRLDAPVQIRFYCTRGDVRMPVALKTYAQRVEDLLGEYRQVSRGKIEIQRLDPAPDSDAEDSARLDGVEGQARLDGDPIYLGLSVSMLDQKEVIPFLAPSRERLLEYDISRAIARVMTADKPVVGIMSPLPYAGQTSNPMMARLGQGGQPPWAFYGELARDFTVKPVEMTAESIPAEIKVLLLIHPRGLTEAAQYGIDQFVLRGGKLVAFLDPMSVFDPSAGGGPMSPGSSSSLDALLKAWGLRFESTKVAADLDYVGRTREGRQPAVLALTEKAINRDDIVTADADNLFLIFAGVFSGTPAAGLKETVLLHTSKNSQLVDGLSAQFGGERLVQDFVASGQEYPLAVRLTGKFKTAFPQGAPGEKKPDPRAGLQESRQESAVVLVGDADFIQDPVAVQEAMNPFGGERMVMPANGNLAFAQGAVEQLAGDNDLIGARSRASRERQFTVVKQMQANAESAYRSKIKELELSLSEAQTKLTALQATKADAASGQRFILSPEQQREIANFRQKEAGVKSQLKAERKKLRADIDSLETRVQWVNIALMPALVAGAGVGLAIARRRRRAAR